MGSVLMCHLQSLVNLRGLGLELDSIRKQLQIIIAKKTAKRNRRILFHVIGWGGGGIATLLLGWIVVIYVVPQLWLSELENKVASANDPSNTKELERPGLNANSDRDGTNKQMAQSPVQPDKTRSKPNSDNRDSISNSSDSIEDELATTNSKTVSPDNSGVDHRKPREHPQNTPAEKTAPSLAISPFDKINAKLHQNRWAKFLNVPVEFENSIGMKFALIPPGEFIMGSPIDEHGRNDDENQHLVRISRPFLVGRYEVTQSQYQEILGFNPSWLSSNGKFKQKVVGLDTSDFPVEKLTWYDAAIFCNKLSKLDGLEPSYRITEIEKKDDWVISAVVELNDGYGYRLLTEAEWEYSCRAGTTTPFHFGTQNNSNLTNVRAAKPYGTKKTGPDLKRTTNVGSYPSNAFGLSNMHGNVCEWVWDRYGEYHYHNSLTIDPQGPASGKNRIYRGESWIGVANGSRSASRFRSSPSGPGSGGGFRVALEITNVVQLSTSPKIRQRSGVDSSANPAKTPPPVARAPFNTDDSL